MSGTITALVMQKRNKERVNVFLEGEFAFGLTLNEALHLKKGQFLSDQEIDRLKANDEIDVARESALHYLSFRPRSSGEVRSNLSGKGFSETAIETVIARLEDVGLLNDEEFCRLWVNSRDQSKPRGKIALRYELRQKGVDDSLIDAILDDYDEEDAAYRAALPRLQRYERADQATFTKQLGAFLQRQGFPYSIVREILEKVWTETLSDETD